MPRISGRYDRVGRPAIACLASVVCGIACFEPVSSKFPDAAGRPGLDAAQSWPDARTTEDAATSDASGFLNDATFGPDAATDDPDASDVPDTCYPRMSKDAAVPAHPCNCGSGVNCGFVYWDRPTAPCPQGFPYCCSGAEGRSWCYSEDCLLARSNEPLCVRNDAPRDGGILDDAGNVLCAFQYGPPCDVAASGRCPFFRPYCCPGPSNAGWYACTTLECAEDPGACFLWLRQDAGF
jgi:hypothetical protein